MFFKIKRDYGNDVTQEKKVRKAKKRKRSCNSWNNNSSTKEQMKVIGHFLIATVEARR